RYFLYGVNETDDEGFTGLTILQLDSMVTGRSATRQIPEHVLNNWNAPAVLLDNQLFLAATNSNGPKPLMMELVKADTEFNSCCTLSPSLFQQSFPSLQVVPYWVNMGPDDHSPDITYLILLTEDVQVDTSLVCTTKPIRCKKALNLGADTVLCTDTFFRIEAPRYGGYRYLWSTSDTATHITVNKSGMVSVIVFPPDSSGCDTLYDSIRITFHKPADPEIITGELFLWPGEISSFALEAGSYDSLKWYINNVEQIPSTPFSYMFPHNGIYHIKVQAWSEQCMVSDSLTITVDGYSLYIPDIFTPNNDGINELFEPRGKGLESYTLSIYNMWGGLVHASRNSGWNGKGCADGSYVYLLEALDGKGRPRFVNGKVTLVR
ncbi:MAG: gliding motility-associated C-terminal domain-containing protein, partial [Bacteroidota bacterium]